MALAAKALGLGLEYLAITEHSRHLAVAHGLDLLDSRCQMAKEEGVLVSINSTPTALSIFPISNMASARPGAAG